MKYYPLGTIVLLEGGNKKIMICGRYQEKLDTKELFDYCACLFPEGVIESNQMYLFQHEDIKEVFYTGYENEEEIEFQKVLQEYRMK